MKVTYICNSDFGKHGTIGFRTYHMAKEAKKRGYLNKVIARGNFQKEIKVAKIHNRTISLGLAFTQQYIYRDLKKGRLNNRIFEELALRKLDKCDILHCFDYLPKLMKKAKEMGAIIILDTQMGYLKEARRVLKKEYKKHGKLWKENQDELKAIKIANYIICASEFAKGTFYNNGIPDNKLKVIHHGVDTNYFKPIKRKLTNRPTFICVGMVEPRKGIEYLIKAFEGIEADLIIAGRITKNMKIKELPNVELVGQVDIKKYYDKSDIFILPSLFETSAKAMYEAMACGLPVIVTPNTGPFFKDRICGHIVPIKNVKALKYSIRHFIEHPMHIIEMGKAARKIVEKYTWKYYGENINDFYEEIL